MTDADVVTQAAYLAPRWRGERGRLEVWYTTLTDPATGTGVWIHHEVVAPSDGGPAQALGWAAVFPPDQPPRFGRFRGPSVANAEAGLFFAADGAELTADRLRGSTTEGAEIAWDLSCRGGGAPLFTFPRWAWQRQLLPAAQIVPAPTATFTGTMSVDGRDVIIRDAPGGTARIYGHGNARRWSWLHADLGGGDVCEVVAPVSTRPVLRWLPPLPFVRLRVDGTELPAGDPLLAALRLRAHIALPTWTITGRAGGRRLHIEVTQPPEHTVAVDYTDPDGSKAVCHNSERANATITLHRRVGREWVTERRWDLDGTAHAEVGRRD
jgi:hypothetical protein